MKKKSNIGFMIGIFMLVIGLLAAIFFLNQYQEKTTQSSLPSYSDIAAVKVPSDMNLANQPVIGDEKAPVEIVEFGDFKCVFCKRWEQEVYPLLKRDYIDTGKVKLHFINYQFLGADAINAGIAGEIIYQQNPEKFWDFYKALYDNQGSEAGLWATDTFLSNLVRKHVTGIDYDQFEKDLKSKKHLDKVKQDHEIAKKHGVTGTPTIFVNGEAAADPTYASLKVIIEAELAEKKND